MVIDVHRFDPDYLRPRVDSPRKPFQITLGGLLLLVPQVRAARQEAELQTQLDREQQKPIGHDRISA